MKRYLAIKCYKSTNTMCATNTTFLPECLRCLHKCLHIFN